MISVIHVVPIISVICMIIKTRTAAWLFVENLRYLHNPNTLSWNWPRTTFSQNWTHIFGPTPNHCDIFAVSSDTHIIMWKFIKYFTVSDRWEIVSFCSDEIELGKISVKTVESNLLLGLNLGLLNQGWINLRTETKTEGWQDFLLLANCKVRVRDAPLYQSCSFFFNKTPLIPVPPPFLWNIW